MKPITYFFIGFLLGSVLVGVAWAAQGLVLVNGGGTEIGTASNPLYVTAV